jgi:hypothetical protein
MEFRNPRFEALTLEQSDKKFKFDPSTCKVVDDATDNVKGQLQQWALQRNAAAQAPAAVPAGTGTPAPSATGTSVR